MGLAVVLFLCYWIVALVAVYLVRTHQDKPVTQALAMQPISFALYAIVRRITIWSGPDPAPLLYDHYLVFFWLWLAAWGVWAVWITHRLRRNKTAIGPDGQGWQLVHGRANGLDVVAAKPVRQIIRAQVAAARAAETAATTTSEAAPLHLSQTGD